MYRLLNSSLYVDGFLPTLLNCPLLITNFLYLQEEETGSIDTGYAEEGDREEGEAPEFNDGKLDVFIF